jgi:hypothetical protein
VVCVAIHTCGEKREVGDATGNSLKRLIVVPKSSFRRANVAAAKIIFGRRMLTIERHRPGVDHGAVEDLSTAQIARSAAVATKFIALLTFQSDWA